MQNLVIYPRRLFPSLRSGDPREIRTTSWAQLLYTALIAKQISIVEIQECRCRIGSRTRTLRWEAESRETDFEQDITTRKRSFRTVWSETSGISCLPRPPSSRFMPPRLFWLASCPSSFLCLCCCSFVCVHTQTVVFIHRVVSQDRPEPTGHPKKVNLSQAFADAGFTSGERAMVG